MSSPLVPVWFLLGVLPFSVTTARACAPAQQAPKASADEQYRYLAGLVERGLNELAVPEAREFLRAHPKHPKADLVRYRLAGALWELARRDEASREYETLARSEGFEYRAECLFRLGQAASERGDEARARSAFEGVLAAGQDYLLGPARFALGELHFHARRYAEAEAVYGDLLREAPRSPEATAARRASTWCAWERGDAPETVRRARAFLQDERDPAAREELLVLLGEALLGSDPAAALESFRALKAPEQAEARARGEGFALAALGDHAAAARAFESLLGRTPASRFAREAALQAGIELLRTGEGRKAARRLATAAEGGDPEALYWLAQAQKQAGDAEAALGSLDQALRTRPHDELQGRILVLRGDCLVASGRPGEAVVAYEQSGSSQALHAAALAALQEGDAPAALRLAERGLRADDLGGPEAQGLRVVLAEATFVAQRYEEAERALETARAGASTTAERALLDSRLAWCRYLRGDLPRAGERFTALVASAPETPEAEEALAMLARIPFEAGDVPAARAPAERYLERHPKGRFVDQALLTLARASTGQEARRCFAQWLTAFPERPERAAVLLELADQESAVGAHADAAAHYAEVQRIAPATDEAARAAYGLAWSAWERDDFPGCERALTPLLGPEAKPAQDTALIQAALDLCLSAQIEQGELGRGSATWRALCATKGDETRRFESARRLLAALSEARQFEAAEALLEECQRSLTSRSLAGEALLEAAYLALARQDPGRAEAALGRARKAGASPAGLAEAAYHLGEAQLAAGDPLRALTHFAGAALEPAGATNPRAADALYKLGFVHLSRGETEPAAEALAALLERHPASEQVGEARFLLGECAYREGHFEEAARRLAPLCADAPDELRAKALFRSGAALGELGRWNECEAALAELARAFPQFPNLAESELWRGRALLAQGKPRAARGAFERTLALDQGELAAGARLGLGRLAETEGRLEDALSEYLKVALLYAHEASVAEALLAAGRVLEAQGNAAKAAARYQELCSQHPGSDLVGRARERLLALGIRPHGKQQ